MTGFITPTPDGVARRIRLQIKRHNLTTPQAAVLCDLSVRSLEKYVYGKSLPGAVALAALAHGLDCSTDWLLTGETRP